MKRKELGFEEIMALYLKERGSAALMPLEKDFYRSVREYLDRLKADMDGSDVKKNLLEDELKKVERRLEDIYSLRERKILLLAMARARGGEPDESNLLDEETPFYQEISSLLKLKREGFFKGPIERAVSKNMEPASETEEVQDKTEETRPQPEVAVDEEEETPMKSPQPEVAHAVLYVLEDMPPFIGHDKTYNLKKEDFISLPENLGQLLVDSGKVRKIM